MKWFRGRGVPQGGFWLAVVILAGIGVLTFRSTLLLINSFGLVRHSHEVVEGLAEVVLALKDAETGQRGYVITGDERYLEPYRAALQRIDKSLMNLQSMTTRNPRHQHRIAELQPLVSSKLAELKESIDIRKTQGFDAARQDTLTDYGKDLTESIRQVTSEIEDEELAILNSREKKLTAQTRATLVIFAVGSIVSAGLFFAAFLLLLREIAARKSIEAALQQAHDDLEAKVDERTAEVAESNKRLEEKIIEHTRAEEELRLLQTVTTAVSEAKDVDSALSLVLEEFSVATNWILGQAWIPFPETNLILCGSAVYCGAEGLGEFRKFSKEYSFTPNLGLPGRVWSSKKTMWIRDVTADPNFFRASLAQKAGLKAGVAFPVLDGDVVVAVLEFFLNETREEDKRLVALFSTVAAQLGSIIKRKSTEDELRASELRYRRIIETAQEGILRLDPNAEVTYANHRMAEMLGYGDVREMIGHSLFEFMDADACAEARQHFELCRRGIKGQHDMRLQRRDGAELWTICSSNPVMDENGQFAGALGMITDITLRKRGEQSLRRLSGQLLRLQDEERRRIASELHDTTAQNLSGVTLNLAYLTNLSDAPDDKSQKILTESLALTEQSLQEIRTLSYLLHPPLLDETGLVAGLRWYADGFSKRSGVHVDLVAPPDVGRLPKEIETALFRVVQESLTNIHRHSGSKSASIQLVKDSDTVSVEVKDAGKGIPSEVLESANEEGIEALGVGITGMRERLNQLGGKLEIHSSTHGTTVRATAPLARSEP